MIDLADDLDAFFDPDDFARRCVLRRTGQPDQPFAALIGEHSAEIFEDHLRTRRCELLCPASVGLRSADRVEVLDGPQAGHHRVEDVEARNDGLEQRAVLLPSVALT